MSSLSGNEMAMMWQVPCVTGKIRLEEPAGTLAYETEGMSWKSIIHVLTATNGLMGDLCTERNSNSKEESLDPIIGKGNQRCCVINEDQGYDINQVV
jgi:hypothetical protein